MKIAYITAQAPWGRGETFIIEEMLALKKIGIDLLVIPRSPSKEIFHQEAKALLSSAIWLPLINLKVLGVFLFLLIFTPLLWHIIFAIIRYSRNLYILIKNIAVIPKGAYLTTFLNEKKIEHIHAHWGATTSTIAYIVSQLSKTPWSFTVHRWDIKENNMLMEKVRTAKFIRCISEDGRKDLLNIIGRKWSHKVFVIHAGVNLPEYVPRVAMEKKQKFIRASPANLLEEKGHK